MLSNVRPYHEISIASCLSFRPSSVLRQRLHSLAMRPLPRLEDERKSSAICITYFVPCPNEEATTLDYAFMNETIEEKNIGEEALSKTQRKKKCAELQDLGAALAVLSEQQLETVALPDEVREQLIAVRTIKQFGARKRQLKRIGGLLRSHDLDAGKVRECLDRLNAKSAHAAREHHRIEAWRDRLLTEGDQALNALMAEFPRTDRQQLRQLTRKAVTESAAQKPPVSARKLYKVLRVILSA